MKNKKIITILFLLAFIIPALTNASVNAVSKNGYRVDKQFNIIPNDPKANKKVVLITIDDGPSKYSKDMMSTLKKHKAGAIFFINGNHVKSYPGNLEEEVKSGFPVGNHTWSHPNLSKIKDSKIKDEIEKNSKLIKDKTSSNPKFFRSPYGVSTKYSRDLVKQEGMISMNWSGAAKDWEKSARDQKIFNKNVIDGLHDGEIILIHEHEWSSKNLDGLLTEIEKKGYAFADPNQIIE
jgi:peptidoglycan/xylan/chitin deacetylase (PgdA/CDA1 family)